MGICLLKIHVSIKKNKNKTRLICGDWDYIRKPTNRHICFLPFSSLGDGIMVNQTTQKTENK